MRDRGGGKTRKAVASRCEITRKKFQKFKPRGKGHAKKTIRWKAKGLSTGTRMKKRKFCSGSFSKKVHHISTKAGKEDQKEEG